MGFKRLIKKMAIGLPGATILDAMDKRKNTGKPFTDCLKSSVKETITEDMPGTSHIYQSGKKDGRVQGTAEQAQCDERKFQQQHISHEEDRRKWKKQRSEYEKLLDEKEENM
jgi:hypothetical protein